MNKLFLLLSLSTALFSCTTYNEAGDKTCISAIIVQNVPTTTAKDIKRGNIYAWVKDITLTATNNETKHTATELFNFVNDNAPGSEAGVFRLNNVAIGINTIKATSTTNTVGSVSFTSQTESAKELLAKCIGTNPYAVYSSPVLTENVQHDFNDVFTIPMNTNNGRVIGVFSIADAYLINFYNIDVSATVVQVDGTRVVMGTKALTESNRLQFYWSNEQALQGAKVEYNISIYSKLSQKEVNTMTDIVPIKASVSYSCNYIIKTPTLFFKDDNKFNFVFQPWKEETNPGN